MKYLSCEWGSCDEISHKSPHWKASQYWMIKESHHKFTIVWIIYQVFCLSDFGHSRVVIVLKNNIFLMI